MDLGFSRMLEHKAAGAVPLEAVQLAQLSVLLAASAAQQAASPTSRALASILRGQDGNDDNIHALTQIFAPATGPAHRYAQDRSGRIDAACLGGSFHPGVAGTITVGTVK